MNNNFINIYNILINYTRNKDLYISLNRNDNFSDRLRLFLIHFAFFLKNFKDIDVFIHTWEDHDYKEAIDLYSPKDYITQEQIKEALVNDPEGAVQNIDYTQADAGSGNWVHYSMFYSMQKSYELIPPGYDIIIRTRFDVALLQKFDIFKEVYSNKFYFFLFSNFNKFF